MSTTIFVNGSIFTARAGEPWVQALVVDGSTIVGVGDRTDLRDTWPDAEEHDLAGDTLVPGSSTRTTTSSQQEKGWEASISVSLVSRAPSTC